MSGKWKIAILMLTVIALISGCFGEKPVLEELGEDGKGKLKVLYHDENSFYHEYGNYFNVKFPEIEFEVISTNEIYANLEGPVDYKAEKKILEKYKPDVMFLDQEAYSEHAQEGKLYNLDAVIAQEKFDLEGYMPGLIDMIREKGNGSMYGLTPSFYTNVMYFNADLFKEHGIQEPSNKMTWQEVIDLSNRFANIGTGEDQIYGIYEEYGQANDLLRKIAATSSLQLVDAKGEKLLINSDGWKNAIKTTADAVRSKAIHVAPPRNDEDGPVYMRNDDNKFLAGKAAMVIEGPWYINQLKNRKMYNKNAKDFDWGIVTVPIDPASPDTSATVYLNELYAISADSANKRAAWEFIKFVNGPEVAKAASRSMDGRIPTRNQFFKEMDGKSMEAFYMLKPKNSDTSWGNDKVPMEFYQPFRKLQEEALQAVIDNKKTVDEALAELQQKGEAALIKAREEEKARKAAEQAKSGSSSDKASGEATEGTSDTK
ncbi:extracellular solute-binding protein [Paenibacillus sp. MER TA 81-3]|uniref:ABC transporter substrate-binding protein n=1 Tax=Paenibacillus sp. MER TA 81-3 TaxID=2939573 RepID=UPI0020419C21|nr:extracellular solute-binding protein [Paenibacillus sp. MER TA 81-3]MCM3339015.1 extracellular solute-binding protein [Paenibacillus sp. MER TA 81-3]